MKEKTKEQIFNQVYMTAQDLKILAPTLGMENCRNIIKKVREEMKDANYYVPAGKPLIALTKSVRKKLKI